MVEHTEKKDDRAFAGLTLTRQGVRGWLRFRGRISYRKVLVLLAFAIALYTGANAATVLEALKNLLTLFGVG